MGPTGMCFRLNDLAPPATPLLRDENRLWVALQARSGGIWGGCVYDVNHLVEALEEELPQPQEPGKQLAR